MVVIIYFTSVADGVDSSHMTASSSASWSRFSPPSTFVNGHACRQCGSWSVAGHNHRKVIGRNSNYHTANSTHRHSNDRLPCKPGSAGYHSVLCLQFFLKKTFAISFLTCRMPFISPSQLVKALKNKKKATGKFDNSGHVIFLMNQLSLEGRGVVSIMLA